jgi:hypothetical protein
VILDGIHKNILGLRPMNSASHSLSNGLGISYVGFEQSFLVHAREKEKILEASCSARSSSSDSVAAIVHNDVTGTRFCFVPLTL